MNVQLSFDRCTWTLSARHEAYISSCGLAKDREKPDDLEVCPYCGGLVTYVPPEEVGMWSVSETDNTVEITYRMPQPQLLQEIHRHDPWRMLVCCILLNQTTRRQVDRVVDGLFERWPGPLEMSGASLSEVSEAIRPLGLQRRRAKTLIDFSVDWLSTPSSPYEEPDQDLSKMRGIGPYAIDSYRIFVLGERPSPDEVTDKELKRYLET